VPSNFRLHAKKINKEKHSLMETLSIKMRSKIKRYEEADVIKAFAALKATRFDVTKIDAEIFKRSLEFVEAHLDGHPQAG
jgi:hypothetical protein